MVFVSSHITHKEDAYRILYSRVGRITLLERIGWRHCCGVFGGPGRASRVARQPCVGLTLPVLSLPQEGSVGLSHLLVSE